MIPVYNASKAVKLIEQMVEGGCQGLEGRGNRGVSSRVQPFSYIRLTSPRVLLSSRVPAVNNTVLYA